MREIMSGSRSRSMRAAVSASWNLPSVRCDKTLFHIASLDSSKFSEPSPCARRRSTLAKLPCRMASSIWCPCKSDRLGSTISACTKADSAAAYFAWNSSVPPSAVHALSDHGCSRIHLRAVASACFIESAPMYALIKPCIASHARHGFARPSNASESIVIALRKLDAAARN